jgi:hypothetical protein
MTQSDDNSVDKEQVGHAYNWLSDHGQVSFNELKKLAQSGTSESLEKLHQLADDNNIIYDESTDLMMLAEEISSAMELDPNAGVE